jgi:hypothetical protein
VLPQERALKKISISFIRPFLRTLHSISSCLSARSQSSVTAHPSAPFFSACSSGCCAISFPVASRVARHGYSSRHPATPFPSARSSSCHAVPFPLSAAVSRTFAPCTAHLRGSHLHRSLPHHSSIVHRRWAHRAPLTPPSPLGTRAMVPQVFPGRAKGTHERGRGIDCLGFFFSMLHVFQVFQTFQIYVAIISS